MTPTKGRLAGRTALVTGSVTGIGAAIAQRFAAEGANVVLTGRRKSEGESTAEAISDHGGTAQFIAGDATDEGFVTSLVRSTVDAFGGLDVLVNNAGIAPAGPLEEMTLEGWDEVMSCNLTSMFLVSKHSIPLLRASRNASVINLSSTFGVVGAGGSVAYALTKAAAISFSRSLALELAGDGIRVNALCPGATDTEFLDGWAEATGDKGQTMQWLIDRHPIGRLGTANEQADAALFLASDESSFVTGHALMVDGGFTAQ